ncbi:MAG TPA: MBL fold metallo-hydrolase [bacterium]|nr:MBL fold metallo-hydrolase [bacterium]HPQ65626.1 MBL fold metallo-hydrolase [bacterium]
MKVRIYGVRGTSPVTGAEYMLYGGETTSILVEGGKGEALALDAGSGLREMGAALAEGSRDQVLILLTHYHLDHLIGFPAFPPLMRDDWEIRVASPRPGGFGVAEVFSRFLAQPFWPVSATAAPARVEFIDLPPLGLDAPLEYGGLRVRWVPVHHPGGGFAYRVEEPATGSSFLFATDFEYGESSPEEKELFRSLATRGGYPDLALIDGAYSEEEYEVRKGWGHNTWDGACALGQVIGARRTMIIHHSPESVDEILMARELEARELFPGAAFARAGMEFELKGGRHEPAR